MAIESGSGDAATPQAYLALGASVLPRLPLHGGDRNRTSPFAFTGNKFEFRALGSSMSLGLPNTVLNTIVAEAIDDLAEQARRDDHRRLLARGGRARRRQGRPGPTNKRIVFSGDNYSEEWHAEAETRGLANLASRPTRCRGWSSRRPSRSSTTTTCSRSASWTRATRCRSSSTSPRSTSRPRRPRRSPARCSCPPRSAGSRRSSGSGGRASSAEESAGLVDEFVDRIFALETANRDHPEEGELLDDARYVQTTVSPAMGAAREVADQLERIVPDDLWPLPKYSEILFIK